MATLRWLFFAVVALLMWEAFVSDPELRAGAGIPDPESGMVTHAAKNIADVTFGNLVRVGQSLIGSGDAGYPDTVPTALPDVVVPKAEAKTVTIYVDGIAAGPTMNTLLGKDVFAGNDPARLTNYLSVAPVAAAFPAEQVITLQWNGDLFDRMAVSKAVAELESELLAASQDCETHINLVSHSMGTIIAYVALHDLAIKAEFSQNASNNTPACTYRGVENFVTLASPLVRWPGLAGNQFVLLGYPLEAALLTPDQLHAKRWINAWALLDIVGGRIDVPQGVINLPIVADPNAGELFLHTLAYEDSATVQRIAALTTR